MNNRKLPIWIFLFLLNGICLCSGFFIIISQNILNVRNTNEIQTEQNLRTFANVLNQVLQNENYSNDNLDSFFKNIATNSEELRITLINHDGTVIADSEAKNLSSLQNHSDRIEIVHALNGQGGKSIRKSTVSQNDVMYYAIPVNLNNEKMALRLSVPLESTVFFSLKQTWKIILWGLIVLLIVLALNFLISLYIVKKINILQEATVQYKKGNFAFRPLITSPKEFYQLGESFGQMAETIQENLENVKKLEIVRTDFVANVSHELKTPVTSIKGFVETLLEGAIDDKETTKHFLEIINSQTVRLSNIIEDLLNLSRLEGENKQPELLKVDIVNLTKKTIENFRQIADSKKIKISLSSTEQNLFINANEGLYCQAIGNIIDNAIKYCPKNSTVSCLISKSEKNASIIIEDDGNGIPSEYKSRIFERFFRVDKGRSRETGGTGLGLSIVYHIVKLHGGTITENERTDGKKGACFEITLPLI